VTLTQLELALFHLPSRSRNQALLTGDVLNSHMAWAGLGALAHEQLGRSRLVPVIMKTSPGAHQLRDSICYEVKLKEYGLNCLLQLGRPSSKTRLTPG